MKSFCPHCGAEVTGKPIIEDEKLDKYNLYSMILSKCFIVGFKDKKDKVEIAHYQHFLRRADDFDQAHRIHTYDYCENKFFIPRSQIQEALKGFPIAESYNQARKFIEDLIEHGSETGAWVAYL